MSKLRNVLGWVPHRKGGFSNNKPGKVPKVRYGVELYKSCATGHLPESLVSMIVYIAQNGTDVTDIFRRPGNKINIKALTKQVEQGHSISLDDHNFYSLASALKKFLIKLPDGVLGSVKEKQLIECVSAKVTDDSKLDECHKIIKSLPSVNQHLLTLLVGTWHMIASNANVNHMNANALARSVAGGIFPSCQQDIPSINQAIQILELLICRFNSEGVFGPGNLAYFRRTTYLPLEVIPRPADSLHHRRKRKRIPHVHSHQNGSPSPKSSDITSHCCSEDDLSSSASTVVDELLNGSNDSILQNDDASSACKKKIRDPSTIDLWSCDSEQAVFLGTYSAQEFKTDRLNRASLRRNPLYATLPNATSSPIGYRRSKKKWQTPEHEIKEPADLLWDKERYLIRYATLNRYDTIQRKQLSRLRNRNEWLASGGKGAFELPTAEEVPSPFSMMNQASSTTPMKLESLTIPPAKYGRRSQTPDSLLNSPIRGGSGVDIESSVFSNNRHGSATTASDTSPDSVIASSSNYHPRDVPPSSLNNTDEGDVRESPSKRQNRRNRNLSNISKTSECIDVDVSVLRQKFQNSVDSESKIPLSVTSYNKEMSASIDSGNVSNTSMNNLLFSGSSSVRPDHYSSSSKKKQMLSMSNSFVKDAHSSGQVSDIVKKFSRLGKTSTFDEGLNEKKAIDSKSRLSKSPDYPKSISHSTVNLWMGSVKPHTVYGTIKHTHSFNLADRNATLPRRRAKRSNWSQGEGVLGFSSTVENEENENIMEKKNAETVFPTTKGDSEKEEKNAIEKNEDKIVCNIVDNYDNNIDVDRGTSTEENVATNRDIITNDDNLNKEHVGDDNDIAEDDCNKSVEDDIINDVVPTEDAVVLNFDNNRVDSGVESTPNLTDKNDLSDEKISDNFNE